MKKLLLLNFLLLAFVGSIFAQETATLEELKAMKAEKEGVAKSIGADIDALNKRILEFPGWVTGAGILLGLDFGGQERWYGVDNPTLSSQGFNVGLTAFANYNQAKYYWRNGLSANYRNTALKIDGVDSDPFSLGLWDLVSSGGYYLYKDKIALSARAKWSTVLFDFTPGSVTGSAGVSYTPIKNMELWLHPLGYQWNYPGDTFQSSPGASFGGSYTGTLFKGISWTSNLEGFYAYGDAGEGADLVEAKDLHNWTWTNGFGIDNLWNGIGVGLNIGIRQNRQLAKSAGETDEKAGDLQSFYNLGFKYSISK